MPLPLPLDLRFLYLKDTLNQNRIPEIVLPQPFAKESCAACAGSIAELRNYHLFGSAACHARRDRQAQILTAPVVLAC
jgi:hypothetical protein